MKQRLLNPWHNLEILISGECKHPRKPEHKTSCLQKKFPNKTGLL